MPSSSPNQISIILADDNPIVRKGVRALLEQEPDLRVVGEAGDGREAIEKIRGLAPDVLLMEISMPGLNGVEATRHIGRTFPETRVVALSIHFSSQFIKDMFQAGARGYVLKESAHEELTEAVRAVMRGEIFLSRAIAGKVVSGFVNGRPDETATEQTGHPGEEIPERESLIRTKFHRPAVPQKHIHRPRLLQRLQLERHKPLTLVSAPAGYGKSILVSRWLDIIDIPSAWLSLETEDDTPRRFLNYFLAAITGIFPDALPRTTNMADALELPPIKALCGSLVNECDRIEAPFVLVLDDVHHLRHKAIFELLGALLLHPPANLHLVLIGRKDPFLPINAFRAKGRITEIRSADLRFSSEEAALLLQQLIETEIDMATASAWTDKTEGWCTGLRLAALAMRRRGDSLLPKDLPDNVQYIMQYLFNEVMSNLPRELNDWLIRTAILDRFCAPLCEAVVGQEEEQGEAALDGWRFMAQLQDEHPFLIDLDTEKRWFRHHHLFRRLLENQLKRRLPPEDIAQLHQRASAWLAKNGMISEAIAHALKAGDTGEAVRLVEQHRHAAWNAGQLLEVERWLSFFPEDASDRYPELLLAKAMVLYHRGQNLHLAPVIDRAEKLIGQNSKGSLRSEYLLFEGNLLLFQGKGHAGRMRLKKALEGIPAGYHTARGVALMNLGLAEQMCGRMDRGVRTLAEWDNDPTTPTLCGMRVALGLLCIHLIAGDFDAAALDILKLRYRAPRMKDLNYLFVADYAQGMIHFHRHEIDPAIRYFTRAMESGYHMTRNVFIDCMAGLAMAYLANGQQDSAADVLGKLFDRCHAFGSVEAVAMAVDCQRRLGLLSGPAETIGMVATSGEDAPLPNYPMLWWIVAPAVTRCRELMANGDTSGLQEAERRLRYLLELNEGHHNRYQSIYIMPLLALSVYRQGRPDESLEILEKAVRLAQPGGWVRPFIETGPPMAELLKRLKSSGIYQDYVGRLLSVLQKGEPGSGDSSAQTVSARPASPPSLVEPLTNRERDILELLAGRLQNKEIADRVCVSPETVKSHLKSIYQKLNANSRIKAVERARQLGLLPDE